MGAVLTMHSSISCLHTGKVQTTSVLPLRVQGAAVLVQESIEKKSIAGCKPPPPPPNQPPNQPCTIVDKISGGSAQKLKVNGQPVMLQTLAGMTNGIVSGVQQPLAAAQAGQERLRAI